jgi:hypothetical protein
LATGAGEKREAWPVQSERTLQKFSPRAIAAFAHPLLGFDVLRGRRQRRREPRAPRVRRSEDPGRDRPIRGSSPKARRRSGPRGRTGFHLSGSTTTRLLPKPRDERADRTPRTLCTTPTRVNPQFPAGGGPC